MKTFWLKRTSNLCKAGISVSVALIAGIAIANPEGGTVSSGSATITQSGKNLNVYQSSDRAVIDWRSFNIAPDEKTQFYQPSSSSTALNRVNSMDPSYINGALSANGNIILINPNGVFFGAGSVVDVNGLIATSSDISSNSDFMNGILKFTKPGDPNASIVNNGSITAGEAGLVGLVAPNVINNGVISAKLGRVELASGDVFAVDLYGNGLMGIEVSDAVTSQTVTNTGTINADGGTIAITAAAGKNIVNSLVTIDGELKAPAVSEHNGKIIIAAEGSHAVAGNIAENKDIKSGQSSVVINGKLDVSGKNTGETGGDITVTADNITLKSNAVLDASGSAGGGTVHIGGEYQGKGDTPTALNTTLEAGSQVLANATDNGNGGEIVAWSDNQTTVAGSLDVSGGVNGGDGGFVETSSKGALNVKAGTDVNLASEWGNAGTWLLDPRNVTISNTGGGQNDFIANSDNEVVDTGAIETALSSGNVTITTGSTGIQDGDILLEDTITYNGSADRNFILRAARNITMQNADADGDAASILATGSGALNVELNADSDATNGGAILLDTATVNTNGGYFIAGGGNTDSDADGIYADDGNAIGIAGQVIGVDIQGGSINTGSGYVLLNGEGYGDAAGNTQYGVQIRGGQTITTTSGAIDVNGTGGAGEVDNYGIRVSTAGTSISSETGAIHLTGTGGSSGTNTSQGAIGVSFGEGHLTSTGTGADASTITINGTGGDGESSNYGVYVSGATGLITSKTGNISITGQGGSNGTSGSVDNYGIYVDTSSTISSTGTGSNAATITMDGTGGAGIDFNYGTVITQSSLVTSVEGNIGITGTGAGTGSGNYGFYLANGADVTSTGTDNATAADISINGIGSAAGAGSNYGTIIRYTGSTVSSDEGDINISGTKGAGTSYDVGLRTAGAISSTGTANTVTVNAPSFTAESDTTINVGNDLLLNVDDVNISSSTFSAGGDVIWRSDNPTGTSFTAGSNSLVYQQETASNTLGVGTGGTNDVSLLDALITNIKSWFSSYTFGRSDGGKVTNYVTSWDAPVSFLTGNDFSNAASFTTADTVFVNAARDVLLGNSISTTSASANALILSAGRNFINSAGGSALSATNSRWLVYSTNRTDTVLNSLSGDFNRYSCTYSGGCSVSGVSIPSSGNGLIYSYVPQLTVNTSVSNKTYDGTTSATLGSATFSGVLSGDSVSLDSSSATAAFSNANVGTGKGVNVSGYAVSGTNPGYQVVQPSSLTADISKADLTVSLANSTPSRAYGESNPSFNLAYSGFVGGESSSVLDSLPVASTTANASSPVGSYAITIGGGSDNNYNLIFSNPAGTLTITQALLASIDIPSTVSKVSQENMIFHASRANLAAAPISAHETTISQDLTQSIENSTDTSSTGNNETSSSEPEVKPDVSAAYEPVELMGGLIQVDAALAHLLGIK